MPFSKKIFLLILVVFAAGALVFFLRKPSGKELDAGLERIKDLAITQKDCYTSLAESERIVKADGSFAEAWQWKGVCEFQLGKYVEASISFKKALALDPGNTAAQNYLNVLGDDPASYYSLNSHEINENFINIKLGGDFAGKILKFSNGFNLPPNQASAEFIVANYISTSGTNSTVNYVASYFKENEYKKISQNDFPNQVVVRGTKDLVDVSVSIWKGDETRVTVSYMVRK